MFYECLVLLVIIWKAELSISCRGENIMLQNQEIMLCFDANIISLLCHTKLHKCNCAGYNMEGRDVNFADYLYLGLLTYHEYHVSIVWWKD